MSSCDINVTKHVSSTQNLSTLIFWWWLIIIRVTLKAKIPLSCPEQYIKHPLNNRGDTPQKSFILKMFLTSLKKIGIKIPSVIVWTSPAHYRPAYLIRQTSNIQTLEFRFQGCNLRIDFRNAKNAKITSWFIMHIFNELWYPQSKLPEIFTSRIFQPCFKNIWKTFPELLHRNTVCDNNTLLALGPRTKGTFLSVLYDPPD